MAVLERKGKKMEQLHTTGAFQEFWDQGEVSELLNALAEKCREESFDLDIWPGEGSDLFGWYSMELDRLAARFEKGPNPWERFTLWVRRVWWEKWASKRKGGI